MFRTIFRTGDKVDIRVDTLNPVATGTIIGHAMADDVETLRGFLTHIYLVKLEHPFERNDTIFSTVAIHEDCLTEHTKGT